MAEGDLRDKKDFFVCGINESEYKKDGYEKMERRLWLEAISAANLRVCRNVEKWLADHGYQGKCGNYQLLPVITLSCTPEVGDAFEMAVKNGEIAGLGELPLARRVNEIRLTLSPPDNVGEDRGPLCAFEDQPERRIGGMGGAGGMSR